jgi:hypothetical protein
MTFLLVSLGLAAGSAYALSKWVRDLLLPLSGLLAALRPLLIPVLVLLAASTVNQPVLVQVLAAIALVPLVYRLVIRPEFARRGDVLDKWWHMVENGPWNAFKRLGAVTVVAVLVVWVLLALFDRHGVLGGQAGLPGAFFLVALIALALALPARLVAYGSTPARGALAALFGLTCIAGLMLGGVLPGHDVGESLIPYLAAATGGALLVAIAVEVGQKDEPMPLEKAEGAGLNLAVIAGVTLVGATASSLWVLSEPDSIPLGADKGAHGSLYTDRHDDSLEYRYAPVLAFTADQLWTPISTEDYLKKANVVRPDGHRVRYGDNSCPSIGPPACLRITISCKREADGCARSTRHKSGDHISDGAVYARTVRRPAAGDTSDEAAARRGLFRAVTPTARATQAFVQYWFFYPYDEWTTKIVGGRLTQRHEGDWEAVTVGFGTGDAPLFVAYSAHCGGSWKRWRDTRHFDSHPLVAVANGSQGNYPDADGHRPPDWTSCSHLPRGIGALLSYAANVRDRTSDDWQWGAADVIKVSEKDPPMNFPGSWGGNDVTEFKNLHTFSTAPGGGPKSPPLQALWQNPIKTIFCDRYWGGPEKCGT